MAIKYQDQLNPWVIYQQLPNLQNLPVVARFRRRNDAESYLKLIQQMKPHAKYAISFDTPKN
jgi:hypothetical protein